MIDRLDHGFDLGGKPRDVRRSGEVCGDLMGWET
jgi:hypothetical protein